MRKYSGIPSGSLHRVTVRSEALKQNMLGDPSDRDTMVYLPPGRTDGNGLPLLVCLASFTNGGLGLTGWKNFGENIPERIDRLIHEGTLDPVVVAFPDCFTRLGGNQYVNSVAMGNWEDYLVGEMTPEVEARFKCGGAGRRGVFGKSSGGYGSIVHAMKHADFWSAAACHSGDMAFEICYQPEFPSALRKIAGTTGSIKQFIIDFEQGTKVSGSDLHVLMTLAMAASYDPDPKEFCGIRLPVNLSTCELLEDRWNNWLNWDPVRMVDRHVDNLKLLKGLWLDCGIYDQYNLLYGARRLNRKLLDYEIEHKYEEFKDNHSSTDYRLDSSLPFLVRALA